MVRSPRSAQETILIRSLASLEWHCATQSIPEVPIYMRLSMNGSALIAACLLLVPAASHSQYAVKSYHLQSVTNTVPLQVDLNRDGVPDFIGGGESYQNLFSANGTYSGKSLSSLVPEDAVGDFNHDGVLDYAVGSGNYLYTYFGHSTGGFTQGPSATGPAGARYVVADFNGDGRPDIATLFLIPASSTAGGGFGVALFINDGGGFGNAKTIFQTTYPTGNQEGFPTNEPGLTTAVPFIDFAIGDFDADGHADLMVRTLRSSWNTPTSVPVTFIRVLYGDGKGNFTTKTFTSGNNLAQVSVADMNNDGKSDIVALNGNKTTIYYGHGDRTFTSSSVSTPGGVYLEPMLVDVTGDGLKDLVYTAVCPSTFSCPDVPSGEVPTGIITLTQTSSHTFTGARFTQVQDTFEGTYIGDLNHDGKLDVALHTGGEQSGYSDNSHLYVATNTRAITAYCPAPAGSGFHVCWPPAGTTVTSPVTFNFSASSLFPIRKLEVWVDEVKRSETYNSVGEQAFARKSLSLTSGKHTVALFAGAYDGTVQKKTYTLTGK
jgi:hypothetical protein